MHAGNNSIVYLAKSIKTGERFIAKYFRVDQFWLFLKEIEVLANFKNKVGFPKIIKARKKRDCSYFIQNYLGKSIYDLFLKYPHEFTMKRIC